VALAPLALVACNAKRRFARSERAVVVTFEVVDERFKACSPSPPTSIARRLLAGEDVPIDPERPDRPRDRRQRGIQLVARPRTTSSSPTSPSRIAMAAVGRRDAVVTGDRYCPWAATVIGIDPRAELATESCRRGRRAG
jgi:hypothetical protein